MSMDILGAGSITLDEVLFLDRYPLADTKAPILGHHRQVGGLVAIALATAARLGCTAAYAGALGDDELSKAAEAALSRQGVDVTHIVRRPDAQPIHAFILVARQPPTRTIVFEKNGFCGADPLLPDETVIRSARVLLVDNWGVDGMIRAARIARAAGIPVVADFEFDDAPNFPELLALADHLIVSQRFAAKLLGDDDPARQVQKLSAPDRQIVIVTCGTEGAWYKSPEDQSLHHQPAFSVNTVDSTGCGDVFHGAYAVTLVRGYDVAARIRFASAAAALRATRSPGQDGIPTWDAVQRFLQERQ